ncbi:MAG: glycosyltransferase family 39 protein [Chitinispirillaceae bacterium]|nr:glycosyltransferase family 39 protein [Chitinispirillaceae bacterium]
MAMLPAVGYSLIKGAFRRAVFRDRRKGGMTMPADAATRKGVLVLSAAAFLLFIPFSGKPFHIDSPVTVYIAEQLLCDPLNPPAGEYGPLLSPWNHTELPDESAFHATPHPPLISLWAALSIKFFGMHEPVVNWAFFPFYLGSLLYFFGLCRRFDIQARLAAATLFAVSPVLFVNAQNVMYDVPLTLFSIGCFYHMFRSDTARDALLAGTLAGCACLTKFTAGTLLISAAVYFAMRKQWRNLLLFALPAAGCNLLWLLHNLHYFHAWQLTQNGHAIYLLGDIRYRFERMIAYIGAGYLVPPLTLFLYWKSRSCPRLGILVGIGTLIWSSLLVIFLHYSVLSALIYWFCAFAGGILMVQLPFFALTGFQKRDTGSAVNGHFSPIQSNRSSLNLQGTALLTHAVLQMAGGLFLTLYAIRYSLAFIFIFILLSAKSAELFLSPQSQRRFWLAAIGTSLLLSLSLSMSDYNIVNAEKRAAYDIKARFPGQTVFFKGRLGYLYYMHRIGAKSLTQTNEVPAQGDLIIKNCFYRDDADVLTMLGSRLQLIDSLTYPIFPLRTIGGRAGFYGNDRLPYAWVRKPPERTFQVYRVVR